MPIMSGQQRSIQRGKLSSILLTFLIAFSISILTDTSFAQSTTEGAIGGTVYDTHGAVVSGATVVVDNDGTNAEKTQTTNESGYFRVTGLTPATYTVTITAAGFSGYKASAVVVEVGRVTEIAPQMGVAGTTEEVVVTG